jgi:hypothetical protein
LAAVAVAAPASAVDPVPFQQNSGFYQGVTSGDVLAATICALVTCGSAAENQGGLDFFNIITPPSGATGPFGAYRYLEWGATAGLPATPYANNGLAVIGPRAGGALLADPAHPNGGWGVPAYAYDSTRAGRSSFEVLGLNGTLSGAWTNITEIDHHNRVINANVLESVNILSWFQLGTAGILVDGPAPTRVSVNFAETYNPTNCYAPDRRPVPGAPINPLGTSCDDYAIIDGFDLASVPIAQGALGNEQPSENALIEFQLAPGAASGSLALVCPGSNLKPDQTQDPRCTDTGLSDGIPYDGPEVIVYTGENSDNTLLVQARLIPDPGLPRFVIGNCEYEQWKLKKGQTPPADNGIRELFDDVNFWGAQWWKNNCMSDFTDNGYPSFKGYATNVILDQTPNCGRWQARPGNSGHPPATLPRYVSVIVTDNVVKDGPNIGGDILQIVTVDRFATVTGVPQDRYSGNPGHAGSGEIISIDCGPGAITP